MTRIVKGGLQIKIRYYTFYINVNYISIQSYFYRLWHIARKANVPIYYGTNISEALTYMLTRLTNLLLGEAFYKTQELSTSCNNSIVGYGIAHSVHSFH